jgi:hypothetical protein
MKLEELNFNLIGWFAIALSKELKPKHSMHGVLANRSYFLSRTESGKVRLNNATEHIMEQNGIIYAWNHPKGLPPTWQVPQLDESNWSSLRYHQFTALTHPQEVYENSIDNSHFPIVHGFKKMTIAEPPCFDDHRMTVTHCIHRKNPFLLSKKYLSAEFEVCLYGLGCAHTHIHVQPLGIQIRMFALTTPTQTGQVVIRLAVAISKNFNTLYNYLVLPIIHRVIQTNIVHDFCQDIPIWENKCYKSSPLLVKGDGPIMKFRRWCQQFECKE